MDERLPSLPEVLKFYAPLAATSVLMMVTHSVISGAVARTATPVASLAAYSVAFSVGQVFESPCYGMQRMGLTFIRGKRSARTVLGVWGVSLSAVLLGYALVSWTPLATWVFRDLLGVSADIYPLAVASLRVFMLWPVFSGMRSLFHPRIVLARRTAYLTANMVARVAVMVGTAAVLPRIMPEGPVGSIILVAGIGTEGILAFIVAKWLIPRLEDDPPGEPVVGANQVFAFSIPLALASLVQTAGRPVVTASLLRAANPEVALAAYQVAISFSYIFVSLTYSIYHVVVIFVKDGKSYRRMQAFCLGLGVVGFILLAACSVPAAGRLIFGRIIGAPADISAEAVRTLAVLALSPLTAASTEFYSGILMLRKRASLVTLARIVNTASTCVIAVALIALFPRLGPVAGAAALVLGPLIETCISYWLVRRSPECSDLIRPGFAPPMEAEPDRSSSSRGV